MTQKEDTKTSPEKGIYEENLRLKDAGLTILNGTYKRIPYIRLPRVIKQADKKDKRDEGIVGYKHKAFGANLKVFITVSVAKTKDVKASTPTFTIYRKHKHKVDKLYAGTSKYGTLPVSKDLKSTSKDTEKEEAPTVEQNLNDKSNADALVSAFVGTWYGDVGFDTIFKKDNQTTNLDQAVPGDPVNGFVTPYNETVDFQPISFGILNPGVLGRQDPNVNNKESEFIHGVRYFRRVVSTLPNTKENWNVPPKKPTRTRFPSGTTIHEETGYILFMYVGDTLTRVVKSLAIPRGITVLASDDNPTLSKDGDIINIDITLKSESNPKDPNYPWKIANGEFSTRNGKISEFVQDINITFNEKDPSSSTYEYGQDTPLTLDTLETGHWNENTLKKQA